MNTLFWYDRWLGDVPLCRRFTCLFYISTNKSSTVADMFSLGREEGGETWSWRRRLWAWEKEMVVECRNLLNNIVLQSDVSDRWQWYLDIAGGYIVRGTCLIRTTQVSPLVDVTGDLIWHKQVPLNVFIHAWRLMRGRMPTKNNLLRCGINQVEAIRYVAGCGIDESTYHMFLHCDIFGSLWQHFRTWIDVSGVDPHNLRDHFIQFTHYMGHLKTRCSFLQLIWLLCVWLVWNERNNRLFSNVQTPIIILKP